MLQHVHEKVYIAVKSECLELLRMSGELPLHCRTPDYLQLVELGRKQRKAVDDAAFFKHHLPCLSRQAENEMRPGIEASCRSLLNGLAGRREIMPPVYPRQSLIMTGFYPVFHSHKGSRPFLPCNLPLPTFQHKPLPESRQIIQFLPIHTVGPRTDHDPRHGRMSESLLIQGPESVKRRVCIGKRLEIRKICTRVPVTDAMKLYPFVDLLPQRLAGRTVARMKGGIVAICASAPARSPIPVRTGEAGIYHHLLQPLAVFFPVISGEAVVSLFRHVLVWNSGRQN